MRSEQARHAVDMLTELSQRGISLSLQGELLRCHAPKGAITAELRAMLLEHKTELVDFLRTQKASGMPRPKLVRAPQQERGVAPLSFAQQRLWFLDQLQPGSSLYNIAVAVRLVGALQTSVLEQCLHEVVHRHESLRTTFTLVDGKPVQVIAPARRTDALTGHDHASPLPLLLHNLEGLPDQEQEKHVQQWICQEAQRPFDLTQGPLFRASLLLLGQESYVLELTMHHIIADGWSLGILVQELILLYQTYTKGQRSPLPELAIQYPDYARWQHSWLQGEGLAQGTIPTDELTYWKEQLADAPALLELPLDHPRPSVQTFQGATHPVRLSQPLTAALRELSQREGVTLFMALLAAFTILLWRYSRQEDIVVGTPVANRTHAETEGLIGLFVNMLVLRTDLTGDPSFRDLLRRVRSVAQGAYAHQDVPFEQIVEALQPKRDLSYTPLFQILLALQTSSLQNVEFDGVRLYPLAVESQVSKFDLSLNLEESSAGIEGVFEYNTDLFDAETIARMAACWHTLLQGIVTDPMQRISALPLLGKDERQQLLVDWNATQALYPQESCIHGLFEAQVERTPDAIAIVWGVQYLTYRELNLRANQLAYYLHLLGVGPEVLVCLCMERSLDLVVGLLGILKAGGAYVPLDATHPRERLAFMVEDAQSPVLLTQQRLAEQLFGGSLHFGGSRVISLETLDSQTNREQAGTIITQLWQRCESVRPEHLAYVIYTSGSTGQPKGVMITHQNLTNLVSWHCQNFHLSPDDRTTQLAGIGFDASAWEIWPSLLAGASLHLPTEAIRIDPEQLQNWLVCEEITVTFVPTPLTERMFALPWPSSSSLRTVLTGGDRLHHGPPTGLPFTLVNNYGPTENTVVTTSGIVSPPAIERSEPVSLSPAIGRPIANICIYLLDQYVQPVPIGVPGELYIGGAGLARGYLHLRELTAERFIPDPFQSEAGARLYRTGDLARYRADGTIEFLRRIDQQVKIRGFRIELGEIEALLGQHQAVRERVVLAREDTPGDIRLVAYIAFHSEYPVPSSSDLRRYLQAHVPAYMVPADFVVLDALPLTANGKVDHRALPAPDLTWHTSRTPFVEPRDSWELQLVEIWSAVLGGRAIGVHDNFFELGGHSLSAVAVMTQIQARFGCTLPVALLFQGATIEQLAYQLRASSRERIEHESWSPLVPMHTTDQAAEKRLPFLCVHGADGTVWGYRKLAQYLGMEQPFYGIQARGVEDGQEPFSDMPTMAAYYLQEVQKVQPEGPYYLGGWSMGGLIALEMAHQLMKQGQQVACVVLIDTWLYHTTETSAVQPSDEQPFSAASLSFSREIVEMLVRGEALPLQLPETQIQELRKVVQEFADSSREYVQRLLRLYAMNAQISNHYLPHPYHGRVLSFLCQEPKKASSYSFPLTQTTLEAEEFVEYTLTGDHFSLLTEPHVQFLAEQIRSLLS